MSPPTTTTGLALLALACLVRPSSGVPGDPPDIVTPVTCGDGTSCPANTRCCGAAGLDGSAAGTSCLMSWSSRVPTGPCCGDQGGGCAAGYRCEGPSGSGGPGLEQEPHCRVDPSVHPVDNRGRPVDQSHELAPRYETCGSLPAAALERPHGLAVPLRAAAYNFDGEDGKEFAGMTSDGGDGPLIANLAMISSSGF